MKLKTLKIASFNRRGFKIINESDIKDEDILYDDTHDNNDSPIIDGIIEYINTPINDLDVKTITAKEARKLFTELGLNYTNLISAKATIAGLQNAN